MHTKEKCDSCGRKECCYLVHIDKDEEQKWCIRCIKEEENIYNQSLICHNCGRNLPNVDFLNSDKKTCKWCKQKKGK